METICKWGYCDIHKIYIGNSDSTNFNTMTIKKSKYN